MRKFSYLIPIFLGVIMLASLFFLWPVNDASAQCGSQASSCKNCHEVQGQDPVNNDGSDWHQSHAFGDFCYLCHGGNNQSMVKEEAHTGMVPVMSDVKTACQSCHPNDLMERAEVYAAVLGVPVGTGGQNGAPPSAPPSDGNPPGSASADAGPDVGASLVVDDADVIDYSQRYDQVVTGRTPINWGNMILVGLIGLVAVGGGAFVFYNERKLRGLPALPQRPAQPAATRLEVPQIEGYDREVLALLPQLKQLNPIGLHALQRLLENPEEASELLHSISRLDPELVRRIRSLDRESRALLLAMSGD